MNDSVSAGELFLNIVSNRRSMRDFKPEPVPTEIIESVFGGAQRAPSNCNTQLGIAVARCALCLLYTSDAADE